MPDADVAAILAGAAGFKLVMVIGFARLPQLWSSANISALFLPAGEGRVPVK